jgi:Flp pilus assembly protein TadD
MAWTSVSERIHGLEGKKGRPMLNQARVSDRLRSRSGVPLMLVIAVAVAAGGCGKASQIMARKTLKEAHQAYAQQDWKKSATLYEETLKSDPEADSGSPYFYLANSYDNQYKPSQRGEAENDALLTKAVQNYETAAEKLMKSDKPEYKSLGKLSLDYLVAAYGPDKLNDPAKAEPVVQRMIQLDPGDPANYFKLAKLYEDAGAYDAAEETLLKAKDARPNDPTVYMTLAGYYNRQGLFEKTISALEERATKEPNNPEAHYTIATFYWDEAFRDTRLKENEKRDYIQKGVGAIDRALQIKSDYTEALVYKGLLLRLQANVEKDPAKQQALIKEATQLRDRAEDLRKKKAAGVGD